MTRNSWDSVPMIAVDVQSGADVSVAPEMSQTVTVWITGSSIRCTGIQISSARNSGRPRMCVRSPSSPSRRHSRISGGSNASHQPWPEV